MQAVSLIHPEKGSLADAYAKVRSYTEQLCEPLEVEDYIPQPTVDVSPAKWNIAHTTWFFEEMILKRSSPDYRVFDENFSFLFNSYYNTVGERTARDQRGDLSRPTVKQVFEYRRYVDEKMLELLSEPGAIATGFLDPSMEKNPIAAAPGSDLVILGLNHEQQHQELFLTDLKYMLAQNPLFPAYRENYAPEELSVTHASKDSEFITVEEGVYEIGHTGEGFCFDNELARHNVYLNEYAISDSPVTNGEFLDFINDGGYRDHRLWHSEGWDWVNREKIAAPLYWHDRDGEWHHFTLGGLRKLPPDASVCHISFYEAAAFAEWGGKRLPTEFEWEAANAKFEWGLRWEWTNSAYLPYPGFKKPEGAVGEYNGKFMINQMVLRGASVATPPGHSRPTYRNFFHPHLRWQFTGIRLAR
ncbi:MAG: ergothioneine biosynthesis protein EgtB [Acidobacteria bacterium]|nr:ergothioneine biosynthesis protein EgtB [Acidobacteriota bacterium]